MKRILFQGDSITDADRFRDDDKHIGRGYACLVKGELGFDFPNEYEFINRAVSGDRIVDMYARIKRDVINLKPDVMSILIGINDVWHEYSFGGENGVDAEKYYKIYSMFIEEIKEALPNTKIMILEPFTLKGTGNSHCYDVFRAETEKRAEKARMIAEKYNLKFIPLQAEFDKLSADTPEDYWLEDGVHPRETGHELIKREWIKAFKTL